MPSWLKETVVAVGAVLLFGMLLGAKLTQLDNVAFRMCRIEQALNIPPDPTCYSYRGFVPQAASRSSSATRIRQ